jgi:hypothetical protein
MRTSSKVDSQAIVPHTNVNGHIRKDPKPATSLARKQAKARNRRRSNPRKQHLRVQKAGKPS